MEEEKHLQTNVETPKEKMAKEPMQTPEQEKQEAVHDFKKMHAGAQIWVDKINELQAQTTTCLEDYEGPEKDRVKGHTNKYGEFTQEAASKLTDLSDLTSIDDLSKLPDTDVMEKHKAELESLIVKAGGLLVEVKNENNEGFTKFCEGIEYKEPQIEGINTPEEKEETHVDLEKINRLTGEDIEVSEVGLIIKIAGQMKSVEFGGESGIDKKEFLTELGKINSEDKARLFCMETFDGRKNKAGGMEDNEFNSMLKGFIANLKKGMSYDSIKQAYLEKELNGEKEKGKELFKKTSEIVVFTADMLFKPKGEFDPGLKDKLYKKLETLMIQNMGFDPEKMEYSKDFIPMFLRRQKILKEKLGEIEISEEDLDSAEQEYNDLMALNEQNKKVAEEFLDKYFSEKDTEFKEIEKPTPKDAEIEETSTGSEQRGAKGAGAVQQGENE